MLKAGFSILWTLVRFLLPFLYVVLGLTAVFILLCMGWMAYFRYICKQELQIRFKNGFLIRIIQRETFTNVCSHSLGILR